MDEGWQAENSAYGFRFRKEWIGKPKNHEDNWRGTGKSYSFQMPLDKYRREMLHGNGDHSANVTRSEKLEEMQGSIVRKRMPTKLTKAAMLFMRQKRWLQRSD